MKKTYLILILLIAAGIGGWFFFFRDSDEQRISKNLNRIIELAEKRGDESVFVLIGDSRKIMRQISEFPEIDLGSPLPLITDREELESAIIQFRQSVRSLSVRVVRSEIRISESGDRAQMELELMGKGDWLGESGSERRRFTIGWVKEEGDWLVKTARHHGALIP